MVVATFVRSPPRRSSEAAIMQRQAAATGLARADKALQILLDAEEGLKTGRYRDADLVVESCMAMIAALYAKRNS